MAQQESLIKTKKRVQQHGEVFTPSSIVNAMLDNGGLKDAVATIRTTVLEPAAGEGIFLIEILKRRLTPLLTHCSSLKHYENLSLLALTTLYGIELLEDNAIRCAMKLNECFLDFYRKALNQWKGKENKNFTSSAEFIISKNIVIGNFLTRKQKNNEPIIFSEWKEVSEAGSNNIKVVRTEYTLDEIYEGIKKVDGFVMDKIAIDMASNKNNDLATLLNLFGDAEETEEVTYRFSSCNIAQVHKEEMEEVVLNS